MLIHLPLRIPNEPHERLLGAFANLKDVQLRSKWETEAGVYLAESQNVIRRALAAGHRPLSFLVIPKWVDDLISALRSQLDDAQIEQIPLFVADPALSETITGFPVHRGALGLFNRPSPLSPGELLDAAVMDGEPRVAVLEGLVDHTNVGALFRSAAALGMGAILVTPDCADPLYRRSVRVSMGAVFQIPWARLTRWPDPSLFARHGYATVALSPRESAISLDVLAFPDRDGSSRKGLALILGSEGPGLRESTIDSADLVARIPLENEVDSLNVATAGAIAFWQTRSFGN